MDKRWGVAFSFLNFCDMAPRTSKTKTPAKASIIDTTASSSSAFPAAPLAAIDELTEDLYDVYNDLLAAKTDLANSALGSDRKHAVVELGQSLVGFISNYFESIFKLPSFRIVSWL